MISFIGTLSISPYIHRMTKEFENFFATHDSVLEGTIIFLVLLFVSFAFIKSYTKK